MTAAIASESTYGAKTTSRRTARPRSRRLSSNASAIPSGICSTSVSSAMMTLCSIAWWNTGSVRARL